MNRIRFNPRRLASPDQAWSGLHALLLVIAGMASALQAASPAIEAALALPRTEPRHYVEASLALLDLRADAEAEAIASELSQLKVEDQALVRLVEQIGTARLTRLGRELPATAPLVSRALDAAYASAHSPERLQRLVNQLAGDREQAIEAIRALRQTGETGADYCVARLADAEDSKVRARLREALVALDPISLPAIYEATGSDNANVRTEAAYALGRLAELNRLRSGIASSLVAVPALTGEPAAGWAFNKMTGGPPTVPAVKRRLDSAIDELLDGQILFAADADRPADAGPAELAKRLAGRLAQDRYRLDPSDRRAARRAVLLTLESGTAIDLDATPVSLPSVLAEALERSLFTAARRCCEAIGERRDSAAVIAAGGQSAPLVRALDAPHPSVRFAAAEAILAINPQRAYAGSSRLIETLEHLAAAEGDPRATVAMPQLAKAGQTAGWLIASGFVAEATNRGSEAVELATASSDTRFALIDMSISLPAAREVLYRLRSAPATALTPIAILAADGRLAEAQRVADDHRGEAGRVIAVPRPASVELTASLAERLKAMSPAGWPDTETRLANAAAARAALAKLIADGHAFYALDRRVAGGGTR